MVANDNGNGHETMIDVRDPKGMGGMAVVMGGRAGRPVSMLDKTTGEKIQGVSVLFFGGNKWVRVEDQRVFDRIKERSWITALGMLITKGSELRIGEQFVVETIDGEPVKEAFPESKPLPPKDAAAAKPVTAGAKA